MEINAAQAFADLMALLCLVGVVMNLLYFNWPGIISAVVCGLLAHNFPGGAPYYLMLCMLVSGGFFLRAVTHEHMGTSSSVGFDFGALLSLFKRKPKGAPARPERRRSHAR